MGNGGIEMKHLFLARHGSYRIREKLDKEGNPVYITIEEGIEYEKVMEEILNNDGQKQMEKLGNAIKEILKGGSAYIISSAAPRAVDSSQILAIQLGLPQEFEQSTYLWSGEGTPKDGFVFDYDNSTYDPALDRVMKLLNERSDKADGLVLLAHKELPMLFSSYFLEKGGLEKTWKWIGNPEIGYGRAVHLDLEQKIDKIIPERY